MYDQMYFVTRLLPNVYLIVHQRFFLIEKVEDLGSCLTSVDITIAIAKVLNFFSYQNNLIPGFELLVYFDC